MNEGELLLIEVWSDGVLLAWDALAQSYLDSLLFFKELAGTGNSYAKKMAG